MSNFLNKFLKWGLVILVFLLPLFFLPLTTDFYDFNKNWLLVVFTCLLLVAWTAKMALERKLTLRRTSFDLPVLLLAISYIASLLFASTNRVEAIIMPGGVGTILALTALYFLMTNNLHLEGVATQHNGILNTLLASASLLALIAVYQFADVAEILIPTGKGLDWLRLKTFTPAGGPLALVSFLAVCLVLGLTRIYSDWGNKAPRSNLASLSGWVMTTLIIAGLGVSTYQLLTTAKPVLLPQSAGWVIALEAFKRVPFFGVGLENFVSAFTAGKPLSLNLNQYWAFRFGASSNYYFSLLTTAGLCGLATFLFLVWRIVKIGLTQLKSPQFPLAAGLLVILLGFVFLPANFLLLLTGFTLLGLFGASLSDQEWKEESSLLPKIVLLSTILLTSGIFYGVGRVVVAEVFFKQSLDAAAQNKGLETYNLQIKSIQTNPYNPSYHIAYSQTNLALANSLASQKELTDQDRQNISQLIQQAIREGKAAVSLGQTNVIYWENLASIYRALINSAEGADQWTLAAYQQAIRLDPANPLLRLSLGGVFYAGKNYDQAINQFTNVVNLKPDYANGYYNLAAALREKGLLAEAVQALAQAQALVKTGTNDYEKVSQELEELRAKLPKEEKTATTSAQVSGPDTLTPPATAPAGLKPPIQLPEEVQPPNTATESGR